MIAAILEADNFLGRILTGRVEQGIGAAEHAGQGAAPRWHASSRPAG